LAAETYPADGEFLQAAVNREEFPKFRQRTGIPILFRRDGEHFKPERNRSKKAYREGIFRNLRKSS
jgi:hypothetical protein